MNVAVIGAGAEVHAKNLALNTNPHIEEHNIQFYSLSEGYEKIPMHNIDLTINVGMFFDVDCLFSQLKAQFKHMKIINQWIGTDIINQIQKNKARPKCAQCYIKDIDIHCVDDMPQLGYELTTRLGIYPRYMPSIPEKRYEVAPLPDEPAVAVYMPPHRKDFYQFSLILDLATEFSDVPFYFFAINNEDKGKSFPKYPNCHFIGYVTGEEKDEWWKKCSVFINAPIHGGCSVMLIEALQLGRYAISSYEYPHMNSVYDLEELLEKTEPNIEASEYYQREYGPEKQAEYMRRILEEVKWIG